MIFAFSFTTASVSDGIPTNLTPVFTHMCTNNGSTDFILLQDTNNEYTQHYKYYGDYLVSNSDDKYINYYIYDYRSEKVLTLTDALTNNVCCINSVFSEHKLGRQVGDLDNDYKLTILDATLIQRCLSLLEEFPQNDISYQNNEIFIYVSDFDRDGQRSILDATYIQKRLVQENNCQKPPYFDKAFVVLSFDSFNLEDRRFEIVKNEYGYNATIAYTHNANTNKFILDNDWDIGLYSPHNYPPDIIGYENAITETPSEHILQIWETYVTNTINEAKEYGVTNPVVWLSRQGCSCAGLEIALQHHNIKLCRGAYNPTYTNDWVYSPAKQPSIAVCPKATLTPETLDKSIAEIEQAVKNKVGISFLTHKIYNNDEDAIKNYGITEETLYKFLDTIKKYEEKGELEVLTYTDVYNIYYK